MKNNKGNRESDYRFVYESCVIEGNDIKYDVAMEILRLHDEGKDIKEIREILKYEP